MASSCKISDLYELKDELGKLVDFHLFQSINPSSMHRAPWPNAVNTLLRKGDRGFEGSNRLGAQVGHPSRKWLVPSFKDGQAKGAT